MATLWGLGNGKKSLLETIVQSWHEMVVAQQGKRKTYRELRAEYPNVCALYARNASFRKRSPNEPVYLQAQDFRLIDTEHKFARWFARIPIRKGLAVFAPLRMRVSDSDELESLKVHDSKLVQRNNGSFELHLSVSKEVKLLDYAYRPAVLSVDLGEKFMATTVLLSDETLAAPRFYGRKVRSIRRHYAWLRKRLGEKKLLREIKRIEGTERRKVRWYLHNISRAIINEAKKLNVVAILLGNLKGIRRRSKNRGRRGNRIVASMPYYSLSKMIEYKAAWEGIPVVYGDEAYSSRACHNCSSEGTRVSQGLFNCPACKHQYNADYNGACNNGKRLWGYIFHNGVVGSALLRGADFFVTPQGDNISRRCTRIRGR